MSVIEKKDIVCYEITEENKDGREVTKYVCEKCLAQYRNITITEDMVKTEDDFESDEVVFCDDCGVLVKE